MIKMNNLENKTFSGRSDDDFTAISSVSVKKGGELLGDKMRRCCIVCSPAEKLRNYTELEKNKLTLKLSMFDFCQLLNLNIPTKSKSSFEALNAPLCMTCEGTVSKIQVLLQQIESLQRDHLTATLLLKEQIIASSKSDEICLEGETEFSQLFHAVTLVRNRLRKVDHHGVVDSFCGTSTIRKRKTHKKIQLVELEDKEELTSSKLSFQRSSFGRVVKRPRHLLSEGNEKVEKNNVEENLRDDVEGLPIISSDNIESCQNHTLLSLKTKRHSSNQSKLRKTEEKLRLSSASGSSEVPVKKNFTNRKASLHIHRKRTEPPLKSKLHTLGVKDRKTYSLDNGYNSDAVKVMIKHEHFLKGSTGKTFQSKEPPGTLLIKCDKCKRCFTDLKAKEDHVKSVHEGATCECQQCQKTFDKLRDLIQHRKKEHPCKEVKAKGGGRKLFECEFCKIVFKNQSDLHIHRRKHTGERPFKCEKCKEAFISKGRYEVHVEAAHPEVPPLKCEFCPRKFFRHHRLRDHKNTHTGERPYQCELCGMSFSQPSYLKYHQTKHSELNLEEFICDQCDKKFASPVNLKFHKETQHEKMYRYHCNVCGHGASHLSHLKLHMRSHTGERPFSCSMCSKTFTRGSQLKIHVRSHTGERPYACKSCPKSFTNSSKLRRHELTHVANKSKRKNIIKITPLAEESHQVYPKSEMTGSGSSSTATTVIIPDIHEENGQHFVKLEQIQSALIHENETQQQLITIEESNGVTYQVIAADDIVTTSEPFTEYIVLNGDFTIA